MLWCARCQSIDEGQTTLDRGIWDWRYQNLSEIKVEGYVNWTSGFECVGLVYLEKLRRVGEVSMRTVGCDALSRWNFNEHEDSSDGWKRTFLKLACRYVLSLIVSLLHYYHMFWPYHPCQWTRWWSGIQTGWRWALSAERWVLNNCRMWVSFLLVHCLKIECQWPHSESLIGRDFYSILNCAQNLIRLRWWNRSRWNPTMFTQEGQADNGKGLEC